MFDCLETESQLRGCRMVWFKYGSDAGDVE